MRREPGRFRPAARTRIALQIFPERQEAIQYAKRGASGPARAQPLPHLTNPSSLLFLWKPRDKCVGSALVIAILVSAAAQRLRLGSGDACDAQQEIKNQRWRNQPDPAPRRCQRENSVSHPEQPLKKVVGMARVFPQTFAAGLALVLRLLLERVELVVGDGFSDHADEPDSSCEFLKKSEGRSRVEAGEQKRKRE